METREKFEALPEFKEGLTHCHYNESIDDYDSNVAHDNEWEWHTQFVSGGWYAFQEQENKIKALEKELEMRKQGAAVMSHHRDEVLSICREYWCDNNEDYNIYIQRIQELLK